MHRLIRFTEQLQLAGTFHHESGPKYARLALILCDNVVELPAHEECKMLLLKDAKRWAVTPISNSDRSDARSKEVAPKLNLLYRRSTEAQRDFAINGHVLRNEC